MGSYGASRNQGLTACVATAPMTRRVPIGRRLATWSTPRLRRRRTILDDDDTKRFLHAFSECACSVSRGPQAGT